VDTGLPGIVSTEPSLTCFSNTLVLLILSLAMPGFAVLALVYLSQKSLSTFAG
jgi:hypothetical protein